MRKMSHHTQVWIATVHHDTLQNELLYLDHPMPQILAKMGIKEKRDSKQIIFTLFQAIGSYITLK